MIYLTKAYHEAKGKRQRAKSKGLDLQYIGIAHELKLVNSMAALNRFVCYHEVRLDVHGSQTEIDVLLAIPPANVLVVEVKSYQGILEPYDSQYWHQTKKSGETALLRNPVDQVARACRLLRSGVGLEQLTIKPCVVMTGRCQFTTDLRDLIDRTDIGVMSHSAFLKGLRGYLSRYPSGPVHKQLLQLMVFLAEADIEPLLFDSAWIFPEG